MERDQAHELVALTSALGYRWIHGNNNRVVVLVDYMEWTGMGAEPATAMIMELDVSQALVALRALADTKAKAAVIPQFTEAEAQWVADGLCLHHERRHDVRRMVNLVLEARSK